MDIIIIFGAPSSGKETISQLLIKKIDYEHISIGEALRNKYTIGTKIREYIDNGNMVNNDIIIDIINTFEAENILLDGFPRSLNQVEILKSLKYQIKHIFVLNVDKEILINRMQNRLICNLCGKEEHINCSGTFITRHDDNIEIYTKRYEIYQQNINEILNALKEYNITYIDNNDISAMNASNIIYNIITNI